ncbi:NUDIX hydrolase [Haploplasma axanthum]|uniref:NUDIX domain n=1 Tax=Haploplasma axanthum TaxID=29552 RepID=A0A449BC55_HAPAX|nr:NUDIX domain-containing protein [Haploplasma axanthum]VEU80023.1 NUDIX domain [Haploplasma axanthum]
MYIDVIKKYQPINEQEAVDKAAILAFINRNSDCLSRDNMIAHLTTSAIVVNMDLTKVVFAYHLIYKAWAWVGGHNDNDDDCLNVAIKEAKEETGLKNIEPYLNTPIMIDIIKVQNHIKHGKYIPDHLHLNLTYLLVADENEELKIKEDENSGVKWFALEDMINITSEERMKPIYQKAFDFVNKLRNNRK